MKNDVNIINKNIEDHQQKANFFKNKFSCVIISI